MEGRGENKEGSTHSFSLLNFNPMLILESNFVEDLAQFLFERRIFDPGNANWNGLKLDQSFSRPLGCSLQLRSIELDFH